WFLQQVQIPTAKTADGNFGAAAAAAVNVDLTQGTATIAASGHVTTSSPFDLVSKSAVNATAFADGTPSDGSLVGVGAALAINVPRPASSALIAGQVTAPAITVENVMGGSGTNTYQATADSGAGATNTGAAGALAINVPGGQNEAGIHDGANVT